ncbi:Uncharacterised protein [Chryseobacterium nakagawai]|uniref:Uncharacterized protein n=1 Tax=Chryseobacterium nakagawai TaxID=1241982 RepID=A0AAD0YQC0_CHRNA|nr:hypothetical protein [Chryseobacterium nakagawai]AZA92123.1 hypothetical protein EG343_16605 [Chryseobacterium nakagawai]VEH18663.1 Uncharacterised protein [Chryseobacterium nakagawai]
MKTLKLIYVLVILLLSHFCFGQEEKEKGIDLDILRAQASPGANLLGIANSDIEKPTDLKSIMVALREGTSNFSSLPTSFAIDLAPFKLNGNYQDLRANTDFATTFKQTFVTSLAYKGIAADEDLNIEEKSRIGFGIKFSIKRGKFNSETMSALDKIHEVHQLLQERRIWVNNTSPELAELDRINSSLLHKKRLLEDAEKTNTVEYKELEKQIEEIRIDIENYHKKVIDDEEKIQEITKIAKDIKLERFGLFLDMSMGTVLDFRTNTFNNSQISKVGAWLTGGYNWQKNPSTFIFMARYLYNPDSSLANPSLKKENLHTLDMGSRLIFRLFDDKFFLSGECIYRSILNKSAFEASWKYILNFEYELAKNQRLTFSFGKDFNGDYEKKGNLIVALNLLVGLGRMKL